jgi:predicted transcriptional regulator of viral defense system
VIANALYTPSYLSFESALSRHGLLSQIPASLTFATTRKSRRMTLSTTEIEYRKVKTSLFFGYTAGNGLLIAEPEKALLDALYMVSRGKLMLKTGQLDIKGLRRTRLANYAKKYPVGVRDRMRELIKA